MFELVRHDLHRQCRRASFWMTAGLIQFLFGWLFLEMLEQYLYQQPALNTQGNNPGFSAFLVANYLAPSTTVLMFATPLLCMNLLSESYKDGSFRLLQASPLSSQHIAWGKFFSAWLSASLLLLPLFLLTMMTRFFIPLNLQLVILVFVALLLFTGSCVALSLWVSHHTQQPMLAALAGFCLLLLLWLLSSRGEVLSLLSPLTNLSSAFNGLIDLQQLAYFPLSIGVCIGLLARQLDNQRFAEHS